MIGTVGERKVAAVDDEIGTRRIDIFADAMKICGQFRQPVGEVWIGNLGQAKVGHRKFLSRFVIPGARSASPESITTIGVYGFRACASKSAVADLDIDNAELG